MGPRVMVMAGGTGGHVLPALAVARRLRELGAEVLWLGTRRGLESSLVPAAGFDMEWIDGQGLRGKGLMGWLAAPLRLGRAPYLPEVNGAVEFGPNGLGLVGSRSEIWSQDGVLLAHGATQCMSRRRG